MISYRAGIEKYLDITIPYFVFEFFLDGGYWTTPQTIFYTKSFLKIRYI